MFGIKTKFLYDVDQVVICSDLEQNTKHQCRSTEYYTLYNYRYTNYIYYTGIFTPRLDLTSLFECELLTTITFFLLFYQVSFHPVSQFRSKFQEVNPKCHSIGHASSDVIVPSCTDFNKRSCPSIWFKCQKGPVMETD